MMVRRPKPGAQIAGVPSDPSPSARSRPCAARPRHRWEPRPEAIGRPLAPYPAFCPPASGAPPGTGPAPTDVHPAPMTTDSWPSARPPAPAPPAQQPGPYGLSLVHRPTWPAPWCRPLRWGQRHPGATAAPGPHPGPSAPWLPCACALVACPAWTPTPQRAASRYSSARPRPSLPWPGQEGYCQPQTTNPVPEWDSYHPPHA